MSSNAFARSRPRVRHQRVPRTHCYVHPRFLQLVKELARIDEAKKKQEEAEGDGSRGSNCDVGGGDDGGGGSAGGSSSGCSTTDTPVIVECCSSSQGFNGGTNICCGAVSEAQTSNGYRSLECNQSTSALNDEYYRQNNNYHNHNLNHHYPHHHASQHHSQHHREPNHLSNSNLHHLQDDRCPSKCSSATTAPTTNFGYSKQGLVEQNSSDFSNINLDLRQDENRSKRKRSSNDSSSSSKKLPAASSCGTNSKRHKSSPEPSRPLSPSFTKCPICLLDCMDRDPSFTNTCFHLFCYVCIENWTKNKATCPLCRTKFTKIIYNIRSASCFDEKVASPIRRDDDDDRVIYEQLQGLNTNPMVPNRNSNADDTRLLFDNLRNSDVLMPPFAFVNQIDPRQDSLHSFNSATTTANFNSGVSHPPFTNYNPTASNYLLIPSGNSRIQQLVGTTLSAYAANTGLANNNSDPNRIPRISRSGRYIYSRNYDLPTIDNSARVSRATSTSLNQPGTPIERQHHHQHQHPSHHQHHNQHNQHRSTTLELGTRQNQRMEHSHPHMPHSISPRYYNPSVYSRRPYTNPPIEQHILDNLYRQMPDM